MIVYTSATTAATDVTTYFKLVDPSTGVPETGLTITDLDATYVRDRAAAVKADLTALAAVDSAHGDNQAKEVDGTNAPGLYRVDWPDAAFAAGVSRVQLVVNGAAIDPAVIEVELMTPISEEDAFGDINDAITTFIGDGSYSLETLGDAAEDIQARLPDALTANGNIKSSLMEILATALTETAGYLAAGFKKLFNVATPVMTVESVNQTGDSFALVSTEVAEILADTNELQAELVDGGRLDLLIDAIKAKTDLVPASPAAVGSAMTLANDAITSAKFDESTAYPVKSADTGATQIARVGADADTLETLSDQIDLAATALALANLDGDVADVFDDVGGVQTTVNLILADTNELQVEFVDGGRLDLLIDAIKAKTDNLPTDPADDSDIDAQLATIAGYLDTEIAAILADTNELQVDLVDGGRLDLLIDAIKAKTDLVPASPAAVGSAMALEAAAVDAVLDEVIEGTVTLRHALRLFLAVLAGKSSGGGTASITFRDNADAKARVSATVDVDGNRTAITLDPT